LFKNSFQDEIFASFASLSYIYINMFDLKLFVGILGYHLWHSDIRSDDSPLEADMTFTCKLKTDIPFVGRQAVEEYKASGIQKRLVCFTLDQ